MPDPFRVNRTWRARRPQSPVIAKTLILAFATQPGDARRAGTPAPNLFNGLSSSQGIPASAGNVRTSHSHPRERPRGQSQSVYVGIDVHRKRSQVAVVAEDGKVQLNKNTVNGTEPLLRLIGDLAAGTPVAFEAAFGWGWLLRLLEDYGFDPHLVHPLQCKAIASARLKNDKVDAATRAQLLRADPLPGVGQFTALVMLAEIGDISRFPSARKLASWAGLTPTVRGSDRTVRHGHISKQGSAWLRWVLNQAAQTARRSPEFAASYAAIAKRRGKKIATIAIARKLLTRAWHLLSDMQATGP